MGGVSAVSYAVNEATSFPTLFSSLGRLEDIRCPH